MPVARFVGGPLDGQVQMVNSSVHLLAWMPPIPRSARNWWRADAVSPAPSLRALQLRYNFQTVERDPFADHETVMVMRIDANSEREWRNALIESGQEDAAIPRVMIDDPRPPAVVTYSPSGPEIDSDAISTRIRSWATLTPPVNGTFTIPADPVPDSIPEVNRAPRTPDQILAECEERRIQIRYYLGTGNIQVREGLELKQSVGDPQEAEDALIELLGVTEEERGAFRSHVSSLLDRWAVSAAGRTAPPVPAWNPVAAMDTVYQLRNPVVRRENVRLDSPATVAEFPSREDLVRARHPDGWDLYRNTNCDCSICRTGRWAADNRDVADRILNNTV